MPEMGACPRRTGVGGTRQVLLSLLISCFFETIPGQITHSIAEEMGRGSTVGNIVKDLGINSGHLSDRKLRLVSAAENQYFTLNADTGTLHVSDRIDREELCGEAPSCALKFEVIVENPVNIFPVEVLIQDINDNPPRFLKDAIDLEIIETTLPGARISLGNARDPDIGINALQGYTLSPNPHFILNENVRNNGNKYAELVLESALDREKESHHHLILTAYDGGDPVRSSNVDINIKVLDANDNFPVFTQETYRAAISEGAANNSLVLQVTATDSDEGSNARVTYSFGGLKGNVHSVFSLDADSGKIKVKGPLDFEKTNSYTIAVEAKDGGGHVADTMVILEVIDENDNSPDITLTLFSSQISEDSPLDAVVALINVDDKDSGVNGDVVCNIQEHLPFKLVSSSGKYYKLVTANTLDRETASEYNITVTATDKGSAPLATSRTIRVQLSDINDNSPVFDKSSYQIYVPESNPPGVSISKVTASDYDVDKNARITYSILNNYKVPLSSYISINSQTGVIYAQRSYDYELSSKPSVTDDQSDIEVYLVVALALISFLFILTLMLVVIFKCRKPNQPRMFESIFPTLYPHLDPRLASNYQNGTLPLPYTYEVAVALDSEQNEFTFLKSNQEVCTDILLSGNDSGIGNESLGGITGINILDKQAQPFQQSQPFQQAPPNTDWRFSQAQRPGTSGSQNSEEAGGWPNNQFETERLQAMILASANEGADGSSTLGGGAGTMGLSTRYGPQFTLQHVPDYRQNVYIPGSTATLTNAAGKRDGKSAAASGGNKKKSGKKEKK